MNTQYFKLNDGTIAYDDQGQGPLVVCIPAGGDTRAEYRFLTPQLVAAGYRVVTMDMRGQGESSKNWADYSPSSIGKDVLALVNHLNAGPAHIVGTSVAIAAAIWAAVETPDLVNGLVLISAYAHASSRLMASLMANVFLAPMWGLPAYLAYFPKMYPSARPADFDEHLQNVKTMLKESGSMHALRMVFANSHRDWDERVERVRVPVLIIMGSKDPDFKQPEQEANQLAARLQATAVNVSIIEGAGHHPQAEMPEQTAKSILAFLATEQPQDAVLERAL